MVISKELQKMMGYVSVICEHVDSFEDQSMSWAYMTTKNDA